MTYAQEIINYAECAYTWMSADGSNSRESERDAFANNTLEELADDCIESWEDPDLDRDRLIWALKNYREWLATHSDDEFYYF